MWVSEQYSFAIHVEFTFFVLPPPMKQWNTNRTAGLLFMFGALKLGPDRSANTALLLRSVVWRTMRGDSYALGTSHSLTVADAMSKQSWGLLWTWESTKFLLISISSLFGASLLHVVSSNGLLSANWMASNRKTGIVSFLYTGDSDNLSWV